MKIIENSAKFLYKHKKICEPYVNLSCPSLFASFCWGLPATTRPPSPWVVALPAAVSSPVLSGQRPHHDATTRMEATGASSLSPQDLSWPKSGVVWTNQQMHVELRLKLITVERNNNISKIIHKTSPKTILKKCQNHSLENRQSKNIAAKIHLPSPPLCELLGLPVGLILSWSKDKCLVREPQLNNG